jgi:hypothetical protein
MYFSSTSISNNNEETEIVIREWPAEIFKYLSVWDKFIKMLGFCWGKKEFLSTANKLYVSRRFVFHLVFMTWGILIFEYSA